MQNPFPGMNPYLEQPGIWNQVHSRLIVAIADALNEQIAPQYVASIEERIYTTVEDDNLLVGVVDIAAYSGTGAQPERTATATAIPVPVQVPMPQQVTERYLEIRPPRSREVISVIELLSPKNKRSGEGREKYLRKRQAVLASATNLVEIDLLRSGTAMDIQGTRQVGYSVLIGRGWKRPNADLYSFTLRQPIPSVPIPLRREDTEPIIELQTLLNVVYQQARLELLIDYQQPLKAVSPEDKEWVAMILTSTGGD